MPGPIDHETFFGLKMNGPRMFNRQVYLLGLAHSLAASHGDVPLRIVQAIASSTEEAEDLAFQINADRAQQREGL